MSATLSDLKLIYLIYGTEDLRLAQALARLKKRVGDAADLDFNFESFEGESAKADDIVAACNTLPFLSERRLVVVKHVDKMSADGWNDLAAYAADPSPTTVLVLVATKLAKNTRLYKAVDKLGGVAEYAAPRKAEYPREVQRIFADRGKLIALDGAELLVEAVGYDLRRLSVEADKAVAFVGARAEVTRTDIEQVASTTAPSSVFEFTDALANRDCHGALRLLADLVGDGESVYGLHALSLRTLRDLIAARSVIERGSGSLGEVAKAVGRPDWMVKNLPSQARGFTSQELVDALRAAAATEAQMKTSRDPRLVFERWIVKVCC
ncbi:MAG TPA: DNA polymerase III subunit delta [Coriobacteriia bacterium]